MHWTCWILSSAVVLALYDISKKASVKDNAVLPTLLCSTLFGCAAFIAGLAVAGRLNAVVQATAQVIWLSVAKSVIVSASWVFTFCALRTLPISIATPIRASAPALVFVVAFFLYGEVPDMVQFAGMIAVFAGYFVFSWAGRHEGIDFFRSRAVWCAVAGAFLSACSSLWDKYVFQVCCAPVETVQFLFQIGLVAVYALLLGATALAKVFAHGFAPQDRRFEWRWTIPCVGILLAGSDWLYFTGLAVPEVPISVASLMRRFSVVVTFVLGARFFHETNLLRKAAALAVIMLGIVLLCL